MNVVMTLAAVYLIDRAGRRSLLTWGLGIMIVFFIALTGECSSTNTEGELFAARGMLGNRFQPPGTVLDTQCSFRIDSFALVARKSAVAVVCGRRQCCRRGDWVCHWARRNSVAYGGRDLPGNSDFFCHQSVRGGKLGLQFCNWHLV